MESRVEPAPHSEAFTADDRVERSIPECFEAIVAEHPLRPAVGSGSWQPTYDELNRVANGLAQEMHARGATGQRVALLMRHDGPLIAAVLAALKAGGIAIVLNSDDPIPRLEEILNDVEPRLLVTDSSNLPTARGLAGETRAVLVFEDHASARNGTPDVRIAPGDLAFLISTSGSTGRPRCVMQSHRNILHNVHRLARGMELRPADRIALLASLSGGQGLSTTWSALLNGAALCPFPLMEKGVTGLAEWIVERKISTFVSAASVFRHFTRTLNDTRFEDVRLVRLASEPATSGDFAAFQKHFAGHCVLFHTLSSSETGNITQCRLLQSDRVPAGRLPAGKPAEGIEILLLDESGHEVPAGGTGEIVVRSRYLSPGYWHNAALTAERFRPNNGSAEVRLFASGDLGRRDPDGNLIFTGRRDDRVKVRGYRIELSEVEGALLHQPGVAQAIVCARAALDESAQLIAFVRADAPCTAESLRESLRATLPGHMVPAQFVFLDQFPLTPHGKIDREKLRQLPVPAPSALPASARRPLTDTETLLAGLWQETLGVESVGPQDHFFDLGGESLKAAVIGARLWSALGVEMDLRAFTQHPTLAGFAEVIDVLKRNGRSSEPPALKRASRDLPFPLSPAQERIWKYSRTPAASAGYAVTSNHEIRGPLDVEALRESMTFLERRHEILRTTFSEINGRPAQIVHPPEPVSLPLLDFSSEPDAAQRATEFFREETRRGFDLARRPLIRFWLVRLGPDRHWLLRVSHHLISDAWSWTIYFRELGLIYEARQRGAPPPLSEVEPLQYGDYAVWQRQALDPASPAYRAELDWWTDQFSGRPGQPRFPFQRMVRRRRADPADGLIWWGIEPSVSRRLDDFARGIGATYYMARLTAFAALLSEGIHAPDLVLGTYVTNRTRLEFQNLFGPFSNLATLRLRCDPAKTFREWTIATREVVGEAQAHGWIPYDQLREDLQQRGVAAPEIRAIFHVSDQAPIQFGGLSWKWLDRRLESFSWGFNVAFDPHNEEHRCRAMFDARRYRPDRVRAWLDRFRRFLDLASKNPDLPVSRLLALNRRA
jgi:amino acid adenylation domain-containing protein